MSKSTAASANPLASEMVRIEPAVVFACAFLFCFAIRVSTLNQNFWEQELVAGTTIQLDWLGVIRDRLQAGEPPLYYLLLKALGLGGSSELTLRLPSAILDSLGCSIFAWVAWKTSGRVGAAALILTFASMPILIRFGQEARPYPLLCFLFALSIGAATFLWRAPRQTVHAFVGRKAGNHAMLLRCASAVLAVAMIAAGWTMVIGWLAVLALQVSVVASPRLLRVRGFLQMWIGLSLIVWLGILPPVIGVAPHWARFIATFFTADAYAVSPASILSDLRSIYGWPADGDLNRFFPSALEPWLGLALVALALVASVRRNARAPIHQAAFVALAVPLVLFAADIARSAVVLRYIHPSLWCLCLVTADGAAILARRWAGRAALVVLAVAVLLQGIDGAQAQRKTSWDPFLRFFETNGLGSMNGYVTDPALALLVEQSVTPPVPASRIELDETPDALRAALARASSADAPVWVLTARPLNRALRDLPQGVASCAGTIGYHSFIVLARSFDLLPADIRNCAQSTPTTGG